MVSFLKCAVSQYLPVLTVCRLCVDCVLTVCWSCVDCGLYSKSHAFSITVLTKCSTVDGKYFASWINNSMTLWVSYSVPSLILRIQCWKNVTPRRNEGVSNGKYFTSQWKCELLLAWKSSFPGGCVSSNIRVCHLTTIHNSKLPKMLTDPRTQKDRRRK